jgi:hypothetical protein
MVPHAADTAQNISTLMSLDSGPVDIRHRHQECDALIELNPIAMPLRGKSRMLFLLSRGHGWPAQALRKSAIKTERSRWNIKDHQCPPSKTHVTNVTPNSSSQAYATVNLKPTANPISKLDTAPEIPTVPIDQPRHPPAACYPKLINRLQVKTQRRHPLCPAGGLSAELGRQGSQKSGKATRRNNMAAV